MVYYYYFIITLFQANALAHSNAHSNKTTPPPPPGTQYPTCFPGHARTHSREDDYNCAGYEPGWTSEDCEKAGCCTDHALYHNASSKDEFWYGAVDPHTPLLPAFAPPYAQGAGAKTHLHTPKAMTYREQSHYCRFMIGHSLGRMDIPCFLTTFPFI